MNYVNVAARYIGIILTVIVVILVTGCGDGGDGGSSSFQNDGNCDGPAVGVGGNDSDNTFHSLAVHPADPNTIIIGSEGNGIFKSTDRGATWTRNNVGIHYSRSESWEAYPEIYELVFDGSNPNRVFAATTAGPRPTTQDGIGGFYYSSDGGETWSRSIQGLHNYAVVSVTQDSSNPNVLYIGMDNAASSYEGGPDNSGPNIYKSADTGLTWIGLNLPVANNRITRIVVDPSDSNTIYCAGFDTSVTGDDLNSSHLGFAKSTDGGQTWTRINNGLASLREAFISIDPNNPSTLYASVWTGSGAGFIFKEVEFTSSEDIVYGSGDQLKVYVSTNGGAIFSPVSGDLQTFIGH